MPPPGAAAGHSGYFHERRDRFAQLRPAKDFSRILERPSTLACTFFCTFFSASRIAIDVPTAWICSTLCLGS